MPGSDSVHREVDERHRDRPRPDQAEQDEEAPAPQHVLVLGLFVEHLDHRIRGRRHEEQGQVEQGVVEEERGTAA